MSGISGIFILDLKGRIIIQRKYRQDIADELYDTYNKKAIELCESGLPPMFSDNNNHFFHVRHNNLIFLCIATQNSNSTLVFTFLYKLVEVLDEYLSNLEEDSVRDNFVIIYELLDEMMDNGYPQTTDHKILREFIKTEGNQYKKQMVDIPSAVSNVVSWRPEGIKYKKNEIYLDVFEVINVIQTYNGHVIKSSIQGMPECVLGLNDKLTSQFSRRGVDLGDVRFHQCVKLNEFKEKKEINFIPPDGVFELMSYRVENTLKPLFIVKIKQVTQQATRIHFQITAQSNFKSNCEAHNVVIYIPVPIDAQQPKFKLMMFNGKASYKSDLSSIQWEISELQGMKEIYLEAWFTLPSVESPQRNEYKSVPITMEFEIPYFSVSGIQVQYLKIHEKSGYEGFPWVRYVIKQGEYHIRANYE